MSTKIFFAVSFSDGLNVNFVTLSGSRRFALSLRSLFRSAVSYDAKQRKSNCVLSLSEFVFLLCKSERERERRFPFFRPTRRQSETTSFPACPARLSPIPLSFPIKNISPLPRSRDSFNKRYTANVSATYVM